MCNERMRADCFLVCLQGTTSTLNYKDCIALMLKMYRRAERVGNGSFGTHRQHGPAWTGSMGAQEGARVLVTFPVGELLGQEPSEGQSMTWCGVTLRQAAHQGPLFIRGPHELEMQVSRCVSPAPLVPRSADRRWEYARASPALLTSRSAGSWTTRLEGLPLGRPLAQCQQAGAGGGSIRATRVQQHPVPHGTLYRTAAAALPCNVMAFGRHALLPYCGHRTGTGRRAGCGLRAVGRGLQQQAAAELPT